MEVRTDENLMFPNDELARSVWKSKYAQENETHYDQMHKRLAKEFARIEESYQKEELKNDSKNYKLLSKYGQERVALFEPSIYELFKDFKYIIPQGSIMSNLGNKAITSLSNCFVIGQPTDSYGGICKKDEEMAQLMKRRGGVGLDISTLRPATTKVSNAAKSSTGAVSFMHRFSNTTREVAQDGRRGALMLSIDINHPDVMDFIKIKRDLTKVTGANISIKLNKEFMQAVKKDEDYILKFPCTAQLSEMYWETDNTADKGFEGFNLNELYQVYQGNSEKVYIKRIKAKEYWDEIIKSAHGVAEPGLMFWDNMIDYSPDGVYPDYQAITTNPCSEIGMQPYDACRLIAVNLFGFVDNPFTPEAKFDFEKFYQINYEAMRLSDNLIDLELEHIDRILRKIAEDPEPFEDRRTEFELWEKIKKTAAASRRTGLGFTALGDTLAALGLKYDSDKSLEIIEQIMSKKMESELDCTIDLAVLRGSFIGADTKLEFEDDGLGNYTGKNKFYQFLATEFPEQTERMIKFNRRNVSFSTVAPTGTVSIMTQTTSGIEPLFMPFYMRRKKINPNDVTARVDFIDQNGDKWQEFPVLHPKFKDWYLQNVKIQKSKIEKEEPDRDIDWTPIEQLTKEQLDISFKKSPYYQSTANDIDWVKRVEIQGIIQKYITHSISSTINLPENVKEEEVSKIYMESWKKGLKGITVYRDGSRSGVLVSTDTKKKEEFEYHDAPKRPSELACDIHHPTIKNTKYTVIVGLLHNKPYEVFAIPFEVAKGYKNGFLSKSKSGVYNLIASLDEKSTIHTDVTGNMSDTEAALTRLISTSLRHGADIKFIVEQLNKTHGDLFSFSKVIARVLKKYILDGAKSTVKCQDCGSENVIFQEGCMTCQDCGSSKCG